MSDTIGNDEFWDIEKLIPKNKSRLSPFSAGAHVSTVEDGGSPSYDVPLTVKSERKEEETVRLFDENSLIRRVSVRRFPDRYDFYEGFRKSALLWYDVAGVESPFVPFYSYLPQYAQLTREQKDYYLWFRESARRGELIRTDYSYLYLYVFEILNLPEKTTPEATLATLCLLWRNYRRALPRIDRFFAVWVQDVCLVYGLAAPFGAVSDFLPEVIASSPLKEFWLTRDAESGKFPTDALIARLSDYDWRSCRFAGGETKENYRKLMTGAMGEVFSLLFADGKIVKDGKEATVVRDAFPYSLCTHSVKCRLEIRYYPLTEDPAVRRTVTAAVRYTENRLRAALGVKSRIAVRELPDDVRAAVDAYFAGIAAKNQKSAADPVPAWEKQYEADSAALSADESDRIERGSWQTTARLVSEEEQTPDQTPTVPAPSAPTVGTPDAKKTYLAAILDGDFSAARRAAKDSGVPEDTLAEEINLIFSEMIGDVVLERLDDGYRLIEDYREDTETWLKK